MHLFKDQSSDKVNLSYIQKSVEVLFKNPQPGSNLVHNSIFITVFWAQIYFKSCSEDLKMDSGSCTTELDTKLFGLDIDTALLLILNIILLSGSLIIKFNFILNTNTLQAH